MSHAAWASALGALAIAAVAAISGGSRATAAGAGALTISVQPVARSVKLGEDIALLVSVDNPTLDPVPLPELRLASDAVSVRVRGAGLTPSTVTRLYGQFAADGADLRFETAPTRTTSLGPGARLTREIRFPAVVAGDLELVVSLACGEEQPVASKPVTIEVTTPGAAKRLLARIETTSGTFAFDLDGRRAFNSVANFWHLARGGFYDGLAFHRLAAGTVAQTGDPRGDGTGTAGWYLPAEDGEQQLERGDVALARGVHADSASSQWFVVLKTPEPAAAAAPAARTFTRLGKVTEGLEILDALTAAPTGTTPPRVLRVRTSLR